MQPLPSENGRKGNGSLCTLYISPSLGIVDDKNFDRPRAIGKYPCRYSFATS